MTVRTVTFAVACACALLLPSAADAQRGHPHVIATRPGGGPRAREPRRGTARPTFPLWLPDPLPESDPAPDEAPVSRADASAPTRTKPGAESSSIQPAPLLAPPFRAATNASGRLRLDVEPLAVQLFVDGFYAGRGEDVAGTASGTGLSLSAGWHRLELRAPGFDTQVANVTIVVGQTETVRATLRPLQR